MSNDPIDQVMRALGDHHRKHNEKREAKIDRLDALLARCHKWLHMSYQSKGTVDHYEHQEAKAELLADLDAERGGAWELNSASSAMGVTERPTVRSAFVWGSGQSLEEATGSATM